MRIKLLVLILILFRLAFLSWPVYAFESKDIFPKIASYYLEPLISQDCYPDLSKYDLLILDVDTQTIDPEMFVFLKESNQDIQFLAYIPSQSVNLEDLSDWARFRKTVYDKAEDNDWWLKDSQGKVINFSNTWPTIKFVDIGKGWDEYLSDLVLDDVINRDIWDGIFYDMVFANLSWLNNGDIDLDQDGQKDDIEDINDYWRSSVDQLIIQTKEKIGNSPLVANLDMAEYYTEDLNGLMMENFPADWLGENGWSILIDQYLNNLPLKNQSPKIYIINSNTDNFGRMDSFREMRFGLASALLGDGYFSFDYGDEDHSQNWWYDEYDVLLGQSESIAYNLLDSNSSEIKPGLWRRNFENGISLVNSTDQRQIYVFDKEEFEHINGTQDRRVNHGAKVNWIVLAPEDGVVLLKINTEIKDNIFINGSFMRVFNNLGDQVRNGFFAFKDGFSGYSQLMITDFNGDGISEILTDQNGQILVGQDSVLTPYLGFKNKISFGLGDVDGDSKDEIITGPGPGGGPHVKVLSKDGELLSEFMAYDENFRGGISVSLGDLDGDNIDEIVTGPMSGGGPHLKVFSQNGSLISEFMAYDENFRGGISVSLGDLDGDGKDEIITGPGPGGGPHVKVLSKDGELLSEFMAYDESSRAGIMIASDDIDSDSLDEILVSSLNF